MQKGEGPKAAMWNVFSFVLLLSRISDILFRQGVNFDSGLWFISHRHVTNDQRNSVSAADSPVMIVTRSDSASQNLRWLGRSIQVKE